MQTEIIQILTSQWMTPIEIRQKLEDPPSINAIQQNLKGLRRSGIVKYKDFGKGKGYKYKKKVKI